MGRNTTRGNRLLRPRVGFDTELATYVGVGPYPTPCRADDGSGLLYYHARYYDSALAKFISPDTIVPGASGGSIGPDGNVAAAGLTVSLVEDAFASTVAAEHRGFLATGFFDNEAKPRSGPANPQARNRYSYVLNGPVRWVDPSGHETWEIEVARGALVGIGALPAGVSAAAAAPVVAAVLVGVAVGVIVWCAFSEECRSFVGLLGQVAMESAAAFATSLALYAKYKGDRRTAQEILSDDKKGSVADEFPSELKGKTFDQIDKLANAGNKAAQKARKLLTDKRFDKGSK